MNDSKKDLLKKTLISGVINVELYGKIRNEIFNACLMSVKDSRDRANWSNWINGKTSPNRFCQRQINMILQNHSLSPIYDETTGN